MVYEAVFDACERAGFRPHVVQEVGETSTLVFVAAGMGVALVPASVRHLSIIGAVYRPLAETEEVELAVATRRDDPSPLVAGVLQRVRTLVGARV